ncbi:unnamed protein product [Closterium sp. NIES-65]|nr:unnamed protein product [Closterium sp. NIES-65]
MDNRVSDHRTKINYDLGSFLNGDIDNAIQVRTDNAIQVRTDNAIQVRTVDAIQSMVAMEQKEMLEELAASVQTTV